MNENQIGKEIVDAAVKIHTALGPGLFKSVYEAILAKELNRRGLSVERQVTVFIEYAGLTFDEGFRADIIVEEKVIVVPRSHVTTRPDAKQTGPLKSIEQLNKVHHKQLFTYLKLKKLKLGYFLNFGADLMKDGIKRMINGLDDVPRNEMTTKAKRSKLGVFGSWREPKTTNQKDT